MNPAYREEAQVETKTKKIVDTAIDTTKTAVNTVAYGINKGLSTIKPVVVKSTTAVVDTTKTVADKGNALRKDYPFVSGTVIGAAGLAVACKIFGINL